MRFHYNFLNDTRVYKMTFPMKFTRHTVDRRIDMVASMNMTGTSS